MANEALEPGTYYQDILTDGTVSVLRQNFPTLNRTSFDTRAPVAETRMIVVQTIYSRPKAPEVAPTVALYSPPERRIVLTPPEETPPEVLHEAEALFRMPKQ